MMPRLARLVFLFACALLLTFVPAAAPAAADDLAQTGPAGCPVNDFQLLGQRWRAGSVYDALPSYVKHDLLRPTAQDSSPMTDGVIPNDAIRAAIADYLGVDLGAMMGSNIVPTLIIIVDDFTAPTPDESHGAAVYSVTEMLLAGIGVDSSRVGLARVDTAADNYNLPTIATRITQVIRDNSASYRRAVVNMSFIILPCQGVLDLQGTQVAFDFNTLITEYRQTGGEITLYAEAAEVAPQLVPEYIAPADEVLPSQKIPSWFEQEIAQQEREELPPAFANGIASLAAQYNRAAYDRGRPTRTNDPFRNTLRRLRGLGTDLILIGSSGNFGQPEPFAPGLFPEVISVSASIANDYNTFWTPSNNGEVMAPGAWFPFRDEFVAGTSFSAPAMSVLTALLSSNGDLRCNFNGLMNGAFGNPYFGRAALSACGL
jgi:hypothetical protein